MNKIVRYFKWEFKNDLFSSTYFAVMLLMYCIIGLILGIKNVDIFVIFEMYLTNYVLTIFHNIFLNDEKEYSEKSFILRAFLISIISIIVTIAASLLGGWFDGMPLWAGISVYTMLIISYLTVWIILKLGKKYDTQKLNDQLDNFKKNNKFE